MAQVVDTKGNVRVNPIAKRANNRKTGSFVDSVKNVFNDITKPTSKPSVMSQGTAKLNEVLQPSTPIQSFIPAEGYVGISGGIPITSTASQSSQVKLPSYGSLLDDGNDEERHGGDRLDWNRVDDDQQTEESANGSADLVPSVSMESSSLDGRNSHDDWNAIYENDMIDRGLSSDYIDKVLKESNSIGAAIDSNNGLSDKWRQDLLAPLTTQVDDGTLDRQHMLSDWMTGKQYYHYVHDLGMPGMPEDEIDISDNGMYSKTQERQENGFPIYIPNSTYELGLSIPSVGSAARSLKNYIGNIRTHGLFGDVDYDITTDTGHGVNSFSGNDFDRLVNGYTSRTQDLYDRAVEGDSDAISMLTNAERHSQPYTTMVHEIELPDGSKHYGVVTEERDVNDLENEDTINDLLWWDIDDDTTLSYPDENGTSTYGNVTLNLDSNNNILSGTWHTKDGFDLNVEPSEEGGFQLVTDDDAFKDWWNSHYTGSTYIEFSDGSSATVSSSDIDKAIKNSTNGDWMKDSLVSYDKTSLKDLEGFDPDSLTVEDPTDLSKAGVVYVPDMVLPDGTSISRDVVFDIANDDNPYDSDKDGISYEFEPSGLSSKRLPFPLSLLGMSNPILYNTNSMPRRLMNNEIIDENGLHLAWPETLDWLADAGADSIPISTPVYQWIDAGAQAMPYAAGIEASSNNGYNRYQTTGYGSGSDEDAIKLGTTLLGPYLENLAGYGHEPFADPAVEKLINDRFAEGTLQNFLLSKGWDSAGEAIEEIIGNYVDELNTYGFKNAWANPISYPYAGMGDIYDSDHNLLYEIPDNISNEELSNIYNDIVKNNNGRFPTAHDLVSGQGSEFPILYDEHGREFRDPNTPFGYRFANAFWPSPDNLMSTVNSALGGAGVSVLYSMPEIMYALGRSGGDFLTKKPKQRNENFSQDEWEIGTSNGNGNGLSGTDSNDIYVPESVKSDKILSNDYRIDPGAPIRFKE